MTLVSLHTLYLDKITDVSVTKLYAICMYHVGYRSLKPGKFISTYLRLVEIVDANPNGISDAIVTFLIQCGLGIRNILLLMEQVSRLEKIMCSSYLL